MSFLHAVYAFFATGSNWSGPDGILARLGLQVELSVTVVVIASVIGVGAGFFLASIGRGGFIALNSANAARAVPSMALLTLLVIAPVVAFRGGGFLAAAITLTALAIPPILTNSYVGMRDVAPEVRGAARAIGMSRPQRFALESRLALPLAVAGVRTAAVEVVATSTLAAFVTFNDLGEYIFAGLASQDAVETFSGALLVAVLAGLCDLVLGLCFYLATPVGLRNKRSILSPRLNVADLGERSSRVLAGLSSREGS